MKYTSTLKKDHFISSNFISFSLNPLDYGCELDSSILIPSKSLAKMLEEFIVICGCKVHTLTGLIFAKLSPREKFEEVRFAKISIRQKLKTIDSQI